MGNLDTPPSSKLITVLGQERSINTEVLRDEKGVPLFPPRNAKGEALPFFYAGTLCFGTGINGVLSNPEFIFHLGKTNPCAYGMRDVLRFADTPEASWPSYTLEKPDYPECRHCEHALPNPESSNGSQIHCSAGMREGSIQACEPVCYRYAISIKSGEAKITDKVLLQAFENANAETAERINANEKARVDEEKEKSSLKRKRKVPPLRKGAVVQKTKNLERK